MKKRFVLLLPLLALLSFTGNDGRIKHMYQDASVRCIYETYRGRIDGQYASYYPNGVIKARGVFTNNYRSGTWTLWDPSGNICIQRVYDTPSSYRKTFPVVTDDPLVTLMDVPVYQETYNKDGYIDFFPLQERAVFWEKRINRFIPEKDNEHLFSNRQLETVLQENASKKNIKLYLRDDLEKETGYRALKPGIEKVIGYRIVEDHVFDSDRFLCEKRILSVCPVVYHNVRKDTSDLYWVYFPQLRKYLAAVQVAPAKMEKTGSLDDLFYFRRFSSVIYKEGYVFDHNGNMVPPADQVNSERVEMQLIEKEHDLWLYFSGH